MDQRLHEEDAAEASMPAVSAAAASPGTPDPGRAAGKARRRTPGLRAFPLPGLDAWSLDSRRKSLRGAFRFWSLNSRVPLR